MELFRPTQVRRNRRDIRWFGWKDGRSEVDGRKDEFCSDDVGNDELYQALSRNQLDAVYVQNSDEGGNRLDWAKMIAAGRSCRCGELELDAGSLRGSNAEQDAR